MKCKDCGGEIDDNVSFLIRVSCRSSEVAETFKHDIHFLGELGRVFKSEIGVFIDKVHYTVTLGSSHILE